MCKRIYKSYAIRLIDREGERIVKLNKNVKMDNFKTAVSSYQKTKNMYEAKNEDITVELVGITQDNEIGNTIYSKQFVREVITEDEVLLEKTDSLVSEIKDNLEVLSKKVFFHQSMVAALDKKQQVILHNIEQAKNMSDKDKLNLFSQLEEIRGKRRYHKEESYKLSKLNSIVNLDEVAELFNKVEIPIEREFKFLGKNELSELHILKEVTYEDQRDKIHKMNELKNEYEKIVDNCVEKTLICYNRSKKLK